MSRVAAIGADSVVGVFSWVSSVDILNTMCKDFLHANVSAIIYLMNYEQYGRSTASAQYFLQLAGYLGIPVISWNADNSGLERTASQSTMQVRHIERQDNGYHGAKNISVDYDKCIPLRLYTYILYYKMFSN